MTREFGKIVNMAMAKVFRDWRKFNCYLMKKILMYLIIMIQKCILKKFCKLTIAKIIELQ